MTTYDEARTALHEATMHYDEVYAAFMDEYNAIAAEVRGSKASMSEADKRTAQQRMEAENMMVCHDLEVARRTKAECQLAFDLADNAAKNARRELDAATADKWMTIAQMQLDAARLNLEAAELQETTY